MKEEITRILLNGMTVPFFAAMLIAAFAGVILFFIGEVIVAIKYDKRTPDKFDFKTMLKISGLRMLAGLIIIPLSIVYFGDMSKVIFHIPEPLEINAFVACGLGLLIDRVIDVVLGWGKSGSNYIIGQTKKLVNGD